MSNVASVQVMKKKTMSATQAARTMTERTIMAEVEQRRTGVYYQVSFAPTVPCVVQVQHPFIVSLKHAFQSASKLYMVRSSRKWPSRHMEYCFAQIFVVALAMR